MKFQFFAPFVRRFQDKRSPYIQAGFHGIRIGVEGVIDQRKPRLRLDIEGNIQGLKQFETEYRARLTEFLGQLVSQVSDSSIKALSPNNQ